MNTLQKRIMRRVYYSFCIKIVTSRLFVNVALLAIGLYGIKVMVNVASFIRNFQSIKVGGVDIFLFNALTHTNVLTLASIGIIVFSLLSFNFSVFKAPQMRKMQAA